MNTASDTTVVSALETALRGYLAASDRPALDLEAAARELFAALSLAASRSDDDERAAIEDCRAKFRIAIARILREMPGDPARSLDSNGLALFDS
jgi:hypothetical protein